MIHPDLLVSVQREEDWTMSPDCISIAELQILRVIFILDKKTRTDMSMHQLLMTHGQSLPFLGRLCPQEFEAKLRSTEQKNEQKHRLFDLLPLVLTVFF